MSPVEVSRILFVVLIVNEGIVAATSKSDELKGLKIPLITSLSAVLLLVPFFYALDYPPVVGWVIVVVQAAALMVEMASEFQLMRARSWAVSANAATNVQRGGMYRFLENPIYLGILLQMTMWALWLPVVLVSIALFYMVVRSMVAGERKFLETEHSATHRGIDSFLWN